MKIITGARNSPLSCAQVKEVQNLLGEKATLLPFWMLTKGDKDKVTSLRTMGKTDFFTYELDQLLLSYEIRIAVHSAKDLPDPLPEGLSCVLQTPSIDPRDSLVIPFGLNFEDLPAGSVVATSSERREEMVKELRSDLRFTDLRGTIHERLSLLEKGVVQGVVVAEAALIRLGLTHLNRLFLPGKAALHQGSLAVLARQEDTSMHEFFYDFVSRVGS